MGSKVFVLLCIQDHWRMRVTASQTPALLCTDTWTATTLRWPHKLRPFFSSLWKSRMTYVGSASAPWTHGCTRFITNIYCTVPVWKGRIVLTKCVRKVAWLEQHVSPVTFELSGTLRTGISLQDLIYCPPRLHPNQQHTHIQLKTYWIKFK